MSSVPEQPAKWSMGLTGMVGTVANMSAVGLISLMFWSYQQENFRQQREDRQMLYEMFSKMHEQSDHKWQVIKSDQEVLKDVGKSVVKTQQDLKKTVEAMAEP